MSDVKLNIGVSSIDAAERLAKHLTAQGHDFGVYPEEMIYCSWPEGFGSTAGPFAGIGGQMMTTFRMEAWAYDQWAVVFCGSKVVYVGEFTIGARWRNGR